MKTVTKFALSVVLGIGLAFVLLVGSGIYYKMALDGVIIRANEQMQPLKGGVVNGRRSGEGIVTIWSHDKAFDGAKLTNALPVIKSMDNHKWVWELRLDLRDSGIQDGDLIGLQGLARLKSVDLTGTAVTSNGVATLSRRYPGLKVTK